MDFFVSLESMVWDALVEGDPTADRALLADDFLGVYPTGFADRSDHTDQLLDGPSVSDYEIRSARTRTYGDGIVLLAYEAIFRRTGRSAEERMFVSSLWHKRGNGWINVFSQDTPEGGSTP